MAAFGKYDNRACARKTARAGWRMRLFVLLPLAAAVCATLFPAFRSEGAAQTAQKNDSPLTFDRYVHDFGRIEEAAGVVSHTFTFTNTSGKAAAVENVITSCGCTTPEFSTYPVEPGGKGVVKVTFNPEFRPGKFEKEVHILSGGTRSVLILKGDVIPQPRTIRDDYPFALGDGVRLNALLAEMHYVRQELPQSTIFGVANDSDTDAELSFIVIPQDDYIRVDAPQTVKAGSRNDVTVHISVPRGKLYGKFSYRLFPVVNGVKQILPVTVQGIATDRFDLSQIKKYPKPEFSSLYHNFGVVNAGDKPSATFTLRNDGDGALAVRWVERRSGVECTLSDGATIAPGKSADFTVTLDTSGAGGGYLQSKFMILTNDPARPARTITLEADIFKY